MNVHYWILRDLVQAAEIGNFIKSVFEIKCYGALEMWMSLTQNIFKKILMDIINQSDIIHKVVIIQRK